MQADNDLDQWLNKLALETPATNLAERIIAAAAVAPAPMPTATWWSEWRSWLAPAPAYALVSVLFLSVLAGYHLPDIDDTNGSAVELWDEDFSL